MSVIQSPQEAGEACRLFSAYEGLGLSPKGPHNRAKEDAQSDTPHVQCFPFGNTLF